MRIALDTNSYSDLCRGVPEVRERCESADSIYLPLVVVGELRAGFAVGKHGSENEGVLQHFLIQPGVEVLLADEETTFHYAAVYRQLRSQGSPIPTNDMWIAALVIQHGLVLLHRDRHFDQLPQLATIQVP